MLSLRSRLKSILLSGAIDTRLQLQHCSAVNYVSSNTHRWQSMKMFEAEMIDFPSHWTLENHRAVCWAHPYTPSSHTTPNTSMIPASSTIKSVDNTTMKSPISNNESAFREEVGNLENWSQNNASPHLTSPHLTLPYLTLSCSQLKVNNRTELGLQEPETQWRPVSIRGEREEERQNFRFLGVHIRQELSESINTSAMVRKRLRGFTSWWTWRKHISHNSCRAASPGEPWSPSSHTAFQHGTQEAPQVWFLI